MRLVQRKHTELPFIADIEPGGPAAFTDVVIGDILLEVNGVDARSSHEELKIALGKTDDAVLKLRRAPRKLPAAYASKPSPRASQEQSKRFMAKGAASTPAPSYSTVGGFCGQESWLASCCVPRA